MTPPTVIAFLMAESIHISGDRRAYVLGTFNGYTSGKYPVAMGRTFVYLALTDGRGAPELTVRLVEAADESLPPIYHHTLPPAKFASPLDVKEVALEIPALAIPRPGVLIWQVLLGEQIIYERRWVAALVG